MAKGSNKNKTSGFKRSYSQRTIKVLFALSGNQCAHPDCNSMIVEPATAESDTLVTAHICHIYAISEDGPRGKAELTQEELNSPENLILLCRNHHAIVDGQYDSYPAELLKEWKQRHEEAMRRRLLSDLENIEPDVARHPYFPTGLVDQKIDEEIEQLRRSRFFEEFERVESALRLGRRLAEGELSGGSDEKRSFGLAWCARILTPSDQWKAVSAFLELAKNLADSEEIKIAEAFVAAKKGDNSGALTGLASINSAASRSAALMICAILDGSEGALKWLSNSGYTVDDLDPDGKCIALSHQLQLACWDSAEQTVSTLTRADFESMPVLHHLAAVTTLLSAVPKELRWVVCAQVPFESRDFRLASDERSIAARRNAHQHFLAAVEAAKKLGCSHAARIDDEYALWLELRDPDSARSSHGIVRLKKLLGESDTAIGFVRYALQFGIKLDLDAVERDIDREIAINGGITRDVALARFSLALTKPKLPEIATYIREHRDQLAAHIDQKLLWVSEIEVLSRAGLTEEAIDVVDEAVEQGISDTEKSELQRIIAEAGGPEAVESRKAQFSRTGALSDLIALVNLLEEHNRWNELCKYGAQLFEETHACEDAERLVKALNYSNKSGALVRFLRNNSNFLSQSSYLRLAFAWGLYYEGLLLESRTELCKLGNDLDNLDRRSLQVNLKIATGNWSALADYVAEEYRNRNEREPNELLRVAQLALTLNLSQAKDLVFEAAARGADDPAILSASYFMATEAGLDDDPRVFQWLEKASELSGEDGPIQRLNLRDLLNLKPEWDRRESETSRLLTRGKIPLFLAAQSLNRTLIDFTIFPALANLSEQDPRRRIGIAAYSGKRAALEFDVRGKVIAVDATALLTLSFLKVLDLALDAFEVVYIPHSTLSWLFQERRHATFHQPSRIANAHIVRDFLATELLEKFSASTDASSDLCSQIGDDLAAMIAEAEKRRNSDQPQHLVVRPAPVHRIASLMEEEADLSGHAAVLSSCLAVVESLRHAGQITAEEEKRARNYLKLHERPWPQQPFIADGATLYLDDLAVTHLLHLGMLGKLKAAGFRAVVAPREVSETDALISYERNSEEVREVIERLRASLNVRIESGQVRVGRMGSLEEYKDNSISQHPSVDILALAPDCDAAIIDDRFLNQHASFDSDGAQSQVISTIDLLDALGAAGILSDDDILEHRTRLRKAGYFLISVSEQELKRCLSDSTVASGNVVETAELKAVRESILRVRMSKWLQLPEEAPWLDATLKAFARVLKDLWVDDADIEDITVRSDWLVKQCDVLGWAHSLVSQSAESIVSAGRGIHILRLLAPPNNVPQSIVAAYSSWVEERILAPIQEQYPEIYGWLVDWHRGQIAEAATTQLTGGSSS